MNNLSCSKWIKSAASGQNQQNGMCAQRRLRSGWSESSLGAHVSLLVLSRGGSNVKFKEYIMTVLFFYAVFPQIRCLSLDGWPRLCNVLKQTGALHGSVVIRALNHGKYHLGYSPIYLEFSVRHVYPKLDESYNETGERRQVSAELRSMTHLLSYECFHCS